MTLAGTPAARSTLELLRLGMLGRQVKTCVYHDVGTGGRAQSLARVNLEHELEVFLEVFRADTTQTAIHHDAEFECHRSGTDSQCSCCSSGVTWSYRRTP